MALLSLVPIALYLVVLRSFDAFSMVRWRTMLGWMTWGVASASLMLGIVKVAQATGNNWTAPWVSPIIEEILKVLPLLCLVWLRKVVFSAETQLYGEAIGGGFALVENIIYLNHYPSMSVATALVRGLGTGLMHMGCTALAATLLLLFVQRLGHRISADNGQAAGQLSLQGKLFILPVVAIVLALFSFVPSISIHLWHNITDWSPMSFMVGMILFFFLAFYFVSRLGEQGVIRWLDVSINDDVSLIASLKQGKLAETKAGEYLSQLRDRFEPLVFFDMCVYVQLYLELLIEAKARVMLRDAGIKQEETDSQKAERQARLTELDAIAHRIPKLGMQLLRPLIHGTDQDQWVLRRE